MCLFCSASIDLWMTSYCLHPKFTSSKHCFLELSQQLHFNSISQNIALVEWTNGNAYIWITFRVLPQNVCRIDLNFSSYLGLAQESKLYVSFPPICFPDCIQLYVMATSQDGWLILKPEVHRLAGRLLEQQRIVKKDLLIPFWVHANVCVFLRILYINPCCECAIMQPNTELNLFSDSTQFDTFVIQTKSISTSDNFVLHRPVEYYDEFIPSVLFSGIVESFASKVQYLIFRNTSDYSERRVSCKAKRVFKSASEFTNKLTRFRNLFCLMSSLQFKTDGYNLYINKLHCLFPQNTFQTFLINSRNKVIVWAYFLPNDYGPNLNFKSVNNCQYPVRLYSCSATSTLTNHFLLPPNDVFSNCRNILLRPILYKSTPIRILTLEISQMAFNTYGKSDVILAFEKAIIILSTESKYPVKNKQILKLEIKNSTILARLLLGSEDDSTSDSLSYFLLCSTLLDSIPIYVSGNLELQTTEIKKSINHSELPVEDLFFGYRELKSKTKRLIQSFLSPLNQSIFHFTILVTSDTITPRIGRKTFLNYLLYIMGKLDSRLTLTSVDGLLLRGKRFEAIKQSLQVLFLQEGISLGIIYNIEHLIPEDNGEQAGIDFTKASIFQYLFSQIERHRIGKRKLILIATSRSSELINNCIRSHQGKHFFQYTLVITRPTPQDKFEVLQELLKKSSVDYSKDIEFDTLVSEFPRIFPGDYLILIHRAIQNSLLDNSCDINPILLKLFTEHNLISCIGPMSFVELKPTHMLAGINKVKSQISELLRLQLNFSRLISRLPLAIKVGILLYGLPGTGKTFLVESIAFKLKMNLIKVRGPEVLNKYVGASEEKVRQIFASARAAIPCLIFFDEFDSIARTRGSERTGVLDRIVNQLLTELDGVQELKGVSVIATTCHPELIDPALLRSGRIGIHFECSLPNQEERLGILESLANGFGIEMTRNEDLIRLAELTKNFTGADIKALLTNCRRTMINKWQFLSFENLLESFKLTQPSLSQKDKEKYKLLYQHFRNPESIRNTKGIKVTFA